MFAPPAGFESLVHYAHDVPKLDVAAVRAF